MRVLVVEPWYSGSHRSWADGYRSHSRHDVRLVTLPGRFWRWRLRGGAPSLASLIRSEVRANGPVDAVLVSGMVDLAQLVGLLRRDLGATPVGLYLHESQVVYPLVTAADTDAGWRSWTSLLAADAVFINSEHHRRELTRGLDRLSATAPEPVGREAVAAVEHATVVPVGVELVAPLSTKATDARPLVLWSHRWDDDKRPEVFVRAVERLIADGFEVGVVLAGEDAWDGAARRAIAAERLGDAVVACGPFTTEEYRRWLGRSDVIVSVTDHEFFGVAVVEALSAGCVPVLPAAHSYPEIVPARFHRAAFYPEGGFRRRLEEVVGDLPAARATVVGLAETMSRFAWDAVAPELDAALDEMRVRAPN